MTKAGTLELARISARGVVQGVGFRPFVYRLATKYGLQGWVCNTSEDVKIEVQGEPKDLARFLWELQDSAPPLARIENVSVIYQPPAAIKDLKSAVALPRKASINWFLQTLPPARLV